MRAGTTGGESVNALSAGTPARALPVLASGPAVSEETTDWAASSAILRARTAGVRMPSSSWASVSRKRLATQRRM